MNQILEILQKLRPDADFIMSTNFIDDGFLDSMDVMELTTELESKYNIEILTNDILPENFGSIEAITKLVRRYGGVV